MGDSIVRRACWRLIVLASVVLLIFSGRTQPNKSEADSFFVWTNVWQIHLEFSAAEWATLQPPEGADYDFFKALMKIQKDAESGGHFRSELSQRAGLAGYFGIDHQYGRATVTIGEDRLDPVGVRYKGNGTFLEGRGPDKLSFKIDFNEYEESLEYRGLTKINLQNNITDPSRMREALSYALFREAGIPCPRVTWAFVYVTVDGRWDRKFQGLYSVVEQIDKRFLKDRFGSSKGLLLKPSTFGVFRYFGDDWAEYEVAYVPKTEATEVQKQRLMDFAQLVSEGSDEDFAARLTDYLNLDSFFRFLAMNVLLSNIDSFLSGTQNYYAYLNPETRRFVLMPWDLDHSFGAFPLAGSPEARKELSIDEPWTGNNRLIERVLGVPRFRDAYHRTLRELLETVFEPETLHRQIDETAAMLRPWVEQEGWSSVRRFDPIVADAPREGVPHVFKDFVAKRAASVEAQLAGQSQGQRVTFDMTPLDGWKKAIVVGVLVLLALLLNFVAYIRGVIAGFRGSVGWAVANGLFYPIAPLLYGFRVEADKGRGAAKMVAWSVAILVLIIAGGIASFAI